MKVKSLRKSPLYEERFRFGEKISNLIFYLFLIVIVASMALGTFYLRKNFGGVIVNGNSMCNTLYSGEKLVMKYVVGTEVKRGDIVVVYVGNYPEFQRDGTDHLIKRLIAVEGDKVKCEDGQIRMQYGGVGEWVDLYEPYAYYTDKLAYDFAEYTVGEGEVFFLGDNRNHSQDSRYQEGHSRLNRLYKAEDIIGVVPTWNIEHEKFLEFFFFR